MRRTIVFSVAILLAGAGITQAAQQDKKDAKKGTAVASARDTTTPDTEGKIAPSAATTDPAYVIGPEDYSISTYGKSRCGRVVPLRHEGRISLALINDVQAAGLSPQQLAGNVTEKLRKYLNEPQVTVIVTAINSQRVYVVGEVLRAGAFPLIPGMTVLQALSSAGGFTTFADVKKIHVMRLRDGKHIELPFNYREVLKGDNPDQNIKLEPGDTVVVP
jgi:polysaccharide export outer membrane protein